MVLGYVMIRENKHPTAGTELPFPIHAIFRSAARRMLRTLLPVNLARRDTSPLNSCLLQKVKSDGLHRNALRHRAPLEPELGCRSIPPTGYPKVRINRPSSLIVLMLVRCILTSLSVATSCTVR